MRIILENEFSKVPMFVFVRTIPAPFWLERDETQIATTNLAKEKRTWKKVDQFLLYSSHQNNPKNFFD